MNRLLCVVAVSAALGHFALCSQAARAEPVSFQGLGRLPGYNYSGACDVSADGSVVAGYSGRWYSETDRSESQACRWIAGGPILGLGFLPAHDSSTATAVAADGSVVVGTSESTLDSREEAFRWTETRGMVGLGFLPGADWSTAWDVSADGSVIVGYSGVGYSAGEAFRWTQAEGMVGLGFLPGRDSSIARGVSADGSVVVGISGGEAFRWTEAEGMVGLGLLPGDGRSGATAVCADGAVIVGWSEQALPNWSSAQGFRWTEAEGMVGLGWLHYREVPQAVSADGATMTGASWSLLVQDVAFVWDPRHGIRSLQEALAIDYCLDLSGWQLWDASGVSDNATVIVGRGLGPSGRAEAWRAVIPEPSSLVLSVTAALGLLAARRWGRSHGV